MDRSYPLSVIVCTYNRAEYLQGCLDALCAQTAPPDRYEVLVVDNNSTDGTAEVVARSMAGRANIRCVKEEQQGLAHARNRGLRETRSPWVAYVDDDGEVAPDFVEAVLRTISREPFVAFGGVFLPRYVPGKPRWFREEFASNAMISPRTCAIPCGPHWFNGGVCAFRRDALEAVGGFPAGLGMRGRKLAYGEETLVQVKLHRAGYPLGLVPDVRMRHWVPPAKYRLRHFAASGYGEGRDSWMAMDMAPAWRPLLRIYGSTVKRCLIAAARLSVSWLPRATWLPGACAAEMLSALGGALGSTSGFVSARRSRPA